MKNTLITHYDWILFDADETLFCFDDRRGLTKLFAQYELNFTEEDYAEYKILNGQLWKDFQNGQIKADIIRKERFAPWTSRFNKSSLEINSEFLAAMSTICEPLQGALSLLNRLKTNVKMGIITNGFTEWQTIRLDRLGLINYMDILVTSEQVGHAKPHQAIFDHALSLMGNPLRNRVLMVGDTFETDIKGGTNAQLHTCWLNTHHKPLPENELAPTYHVNTLIQLEHILNTNPPL
jgi:YjjG family noncanonical pyrimidine nucleotidase